MHPTNQHDVFSVRTAFELFHRGELEEAEIICKKVLQINSHDFNALHLLGVLSLVSGRLDEAVAALESALNENSLDPVGLNNLGKAYQATGRLNDAVSCHRQAITLNGSYTEAYCDLGIALRLLGIFDEAEAVFKQALSLKPGDIIALENIGLIYLHSSKFNVAEELFKKAIAVSPVRTHLYGYLADCQANRGKLNEAEYSCREALIIQPDSPVIYNKLGLIFKDLKRWEDAQRAFETAIQLSPENSAYYTNLGVVLHATGCFAEAEEAFRKSIAMKPDCVEAYCNLGVVLKERNLLDEAKNVMREALALSPECAAVHGHFAGVLRSQGRRNEAAEAYRQALRLDPNNVEILISFSSLLIDKNETDEAKELLAKVLEQQPQNLMALHVLSALKGEDSPKAPAQYVTSLFDGYADKFDSHLIKSLNYKTPKDLFDLVEPRIRHCKQMNVLDLGCGTGLMGELVSSIATNLVGVDLSSRMLAKAEKKQLYQRLIESDLLVMMQNEVPESYDVIFAADVFVYMGEINSVVHEASRILKPRGLLVFSVESLDAVMPSQQNGLLPEYKLMPTARYCHSKSYIRSLADVNDFSVNTIEAMDGRMESGNIVKSYKVLFEKSDCNRGLINAVLARDNKEWEVAEAAYLSCLQTAPADMQSLSGVGACLQMQNRHDEAAGWYERAIELIPSDPVLHCNRALSLLTMGQYQQGWQELQWRKQLITEPLPQFPFLTPELMGDLAGKRLLLHTEQGFGDTLQMLRYLPLLAEKGAELVITVPSPLVRLIAAQPAVRQVIPHGDLLPVTDYQTLLQDLPWLFGTTVENIPVEIPYLCVPEHLRAIWQRRVDARAGLRVGLAWACGGGDQRNRGLRSMQFSDLLPLLALPQVQFYSLQIGPDALTDQQQSQYPNLHDLTHLITDFADTAALILALDYVITVDTAVAHLAGALGKPVWLLLPSFREWRWVDHDNKALWYPTIEVVAQTVADNRWWPQVMKLVEWLTSFVPDVKVVQHRSCRLCHADAVQCYADQRTFFFCSRCGLIFTDCPLSAVEMEMHYQGQHDIVFDYAVYANRILDLARGFTPVTRILDYGAGSGRQAEAFRMMGYQVDCYEPMQNGPFDEKKYTRGYDLILLNEVLEHVSDILTVMDNLHNLCRLNGVLYIGTLMTDKIINNPEQFSDVFKKWWYKDDLTHVSFFCQSSFEYICSLTDRYTFKVVGFGPSAALLQKM